MHANNMKKDLFFLCCILYQQAETLPCAAVGQRQRVTYRLLL